MKFQNIFATKQTFLLLVFSNLIIQILITRYVMTKAPKIQNRWYIFGLFFVSLILLSIMSLTIPMILKFILFCIFSSIMGVIIASRSVSDAIVQIAFYGTLGIFVLMGLLGSILSVLGIKLGLKFGLALFACLITLILVSLFNFITGSFSHKLISGFVVLLFSVYILYDTNVILQRNYQGDFISASVDYYLDVVNIFSSLMSINS